ncbi:succinylglutamate desuccinylase/aspartoacylase family protein [Candidatus Palauibacter sp.]|uniref:succinylglutamate desuccinylase/aspartoacylase family protein n=1 Tax=Candidatus Palauibacter sp. TaxID=3101350 RepID=UPI003B020FE2
MNHTTSSTAIEESGGQGRRIGAYRGAEPGPLVICIASLHGNEPAGIEALERVLSVLSMNRLRMRGDLVGLRGNLQAHKAGTRFIDEDLNRVWQHDRVDAVLESLRDGGSARDGDGAPMVGSAELAEQRELLAAFQSEHRRARGPIHVLDLHTTSSESAPFTTLGDTLQNRALALRLPVPVVLGLEEQIDGAMLHYFDRLGWANIGIEAGQHTVASSVDVHEEAVWILLEALGLVESGDAPGGEDRRARLAHRAEGLPRVLDVRYRHVVSEEDEFRMHPGFRNFDLVEAGQELAVDRRGPVCAAFAGRLFLPLYQRQGDDGFFIVRQLAPAWLAVSRLLRVAGADRVAPWLPGVRTHPARSDAVVVARWARNRCVIGLLHLMGFTARGESGGAVMVRRQEGPARQPESASAGG